MLQLWSPNPRKKRRKMTAKQRKYFGGSRKKRRASRTRSVRRHRQAGFVAMPGFATTKRRGRRRSRVRAAVRRGRRSARRAFASFSKSGAINLLKAGAIGGAGAVAVDVLMGQAVGFLPASMQAPTDNKTGATNYGYFAAKAAIALALGSLGNRLPVIGRFSGQMAEGAMTVMAYQFMRPMVPANFSLGAYFNPAATRAPRLGAYQQVPQIPVRAGSGSGARGSRAASTLAMVRNIRQAG